MFAFGLCQLGKFSMRDFFFHACWPVWKKTSFCADCVTERSRSVYGRQGVCAPDLMGDPASAFQGAVYTNAAFRCVRSCWVLFTESQQ